MGSLDFCNRIIMTITQGMMFVMTNIKLIKKTGACLSYGMEARALTTTSGTEDTRTRSIHSCCNFSAPRRYLPAINNYAEMTSTSPLMLLTPFHNAPLSSDWLASLNYTKLQRRHRSRDSMFCHQSAVAQSKAISVVFVVP